MCTVLLPPGDNPIAVNKYVSKKCHGRIILRWIFRKWEGVVGIGWSWPRIGTVGGHL